MIALVLLALQQAAAAPVNFPWQQDVAYEISARLDEPTGVLSGGERIRYRNASPDTLTTFSLHLYLNAFRPGSRWADVDSVEGRRRFNDLRDPDFAFNHVRDVRIMGQAVEPVYPLAPDSTIVRFALPRPLLPGDSMTVEMGWDARPSTVPRRQGRQGPALRLCPVVSQGGGVRPARLGGASLYARGRVLRRVRHVHRRPRCARGPGHGRHRRAGLRRPGLGARQPRARPRRSSTSATTTAPPRPRPTPAPAPSPAASGSAGTRSDVHHFAMSLNPAYRYEGGRFGGVAVHVLYQPGDETTWGGGVAVERTQTALAWLDQLYGPFGWPQLTNVHRIEGGGTEFPMMIHDGSADQGLIVHEAGHNYTMGLLANNEWREGWLDEGFTSFQTSWFWETMGRGELRRDRGERAGAGPRRLLRAPQPRGPGVPRLHLVQHRDLHPGRAVLPPAPRHRGRRDDAPHPPDLLRAMEVPARRRGRLPRGGRGSVAAGPHDLLCAVAAHDRAVRLRGRAGPEPPRGRGMD